MNRKTNILTSFLLITGLIFLSGCGCKQNTGPQYRVSLEVWGPLDDSFTYSEILDVYKKINPNIGSIEYKKINYDTYRKEAVDAMASGQGPDILLIHNDWLTGFSDKIVPAPAEILNEQKYRQDFVDVAANDFIDEGKIWAAPLSVDSLGLYYNKDYFNSAGITTPPKNWNQFVEDVEKLTKIDASGEIVRSGAAIGTAYNINRSTDLLTLLMMQNGTQMLDDSGSVAIDKSETVNGQIVPPAENALKFYTSFADIGNPHYTWKPTMHYSIDAFSEGTAAMMFNYSWQEQVVSDKAPKLNYAVAPIPQFDGSLPVNYANYWALAVVKNKIINTDRGSSNYSSSNVTNDIRTAEAWRLVTFLTTKPTGTIETKSGFAGMGQKVAPDYDPASEYIKLTKKPSARRDLIEMQKPIQK
jgi:ABC-type glycerol-3-phosphate transport system substrate-binding protein